MDTGAKTHLKALFNTAYYVAKEKVSFRAFSGMLELQEKNGVKLWTQYRNDLKCKEFIHNIAEADRRRVEQKVMNTRFLCIMGDGSTDVSITEQENVYVR